MLLICSKYGLSGTNGWPLLTDILRGCYGMSQLRTARSGLLCACLFPESKSTGSDIWMIFGLRCREFTDSAFTPSLTFGM